MLLNPRYGIVGLGAMPYFVFVEPLGTVIEFFRYAAMLFLLILVALNLNHAHLFFYRRSLHME
jgi:hypothetical protein